MKTDKKMMIAEYSENTYLANVRGSKVTLVTHDQGKAENGFEAKRDYFKKAVDTNDPELLSVYNLHFYVRYEDSAEKAGLWLVDEERAVGLTGNMDSSEVVIDVPHDAKDKSWTQYDKGAAAKKISLRDCTEYLIEKIFVKKNGKLADGLTERASVPLPEFKALMVRSRTIRM